MPPSDRLLRRALAPVVATLALLLALLAPTPGAAQIPSTTSVPPPPPVDPTAGDPYQRGEGALDRLGTDLATVAADLGTTPDHLADRLLANPHLAVDPANRLVSVDPPPPGAEIPIGPAAGEPTTSTSTAAPASAPVLGPGPEIDPTDEPAQLRLASRPGAPRTIHLDLDGHRVTDTGWNEALGFPVIESPAYDLDGNPRRWSLDELAIIDRVWAAVAEDFAPFDVNVTTIEPSATDLARSGDDDERWGVRVVLTGEDWSGCRCGGQAVVGAPGEPVWVFDREGADGLADAVSHQIGHALGLDDDGQLDGSSRYAGHDGPGGGWGPIMGAPDGRLVTQWSRQDVLDGNNFDDDANFGAGADDLAVLGHPDTGFGFRADDHGDLGDETPLNGPTPEVAGVIGATNDRDAFGFTTTGGTVSVTVIGDPVAPNLDVGLALVDAEGVVLERGEPVGSGPLDALAATLTTEVGAGSYAVLVDGEGEGLPFLDPPYGFTDQGSVGHYTLRAELDGVAPADVEAPAAPVGLFGFGIGEMVVLAWSPVADEDLADYVVLRSTTAGGPYVPIGTVRPDLIGFEDPTSSTVDRYYVVVARDVVGNRSTPSNEIQIPGVPADPDLDRSVLDPGREPQPEVLPGGAGGPVVDGLVDEVVDETVDDVVDEAIDGVVDEADGETVDAGAGLLGEPGLEVDSVSDVVDSESTTPETDTTDTETDPADSDTDIDPADEPIDEVAGPADEGEATADDELVDDVVDEPADEAIDGVIDEVVDEADGETVDAGAGLLGEPGLEVDSISDVVDSESTTPETDTTDTDTDTTDTDTDTDTTDTDPADEPADPADEPVHLAEEPDDPADDAVNADAPIGDETDEAVDGEAVPELQEAVLGDGGSSPGGLPILGPGGTVGGAATPLVEQTFIYGTVFGDPGLTAVADGQSQAITETLSEGFPAARHDRLYHRWTLPAAEGNQQLRLVAAAGPDAGDADEGFAFEWSTDRVEWDRLIVVAPDESIDEVFDIGAPEESVYVRVIDTDRTPRQQSPDVITIDLLEVTGDGLPVEAPPDPVEALAEVRFHFQGVGEDGERAVVVTATVRDDQGEPVPGATVEVQVEGDVDELVEVTTGADGSGTAQTEAAALHPEVAACATSVVAGDLLWFPGALSCSSPPPVADLPS